MTSVQDVFFTKASLVSVGGGTLEHILRDDEVMLHILAYVLCSV